MSRLLDELEKKLAKKVESRMTPILAKLDELNRNITTLNKNIAELTKAIKAMRGA